MLLIIIASLLHLIKATASDCKNCPALADLTVLQLYAMRQDLLGMLSSAECVAALPPDFFTIQPTDQDNQLLTGVFSKIITSNSLIKAVSGEALKLFDERLLEYLISTLGNQGLKTIVNQLTPSQKKCLSSAFLMVEGARNMCISFLNSMNYALETVDLRQLLAIKDINARIQADAMVHLTKNRMDCSAMSVRMLSYYTHGNPTEQFTQEASQAVRGACFSTLSDLGLLEASMIEQVASEAFEQVVKPLPSHFIGAMNSEQIAAFDAKAPPETMCHHLKLDQITCADKLESVRPQCFTGLLSNGSGRVVIPEDLFRRNPALVGAITTPEQLDKADLSHVSAKYLVELIQTVLGPKYPGQTHSACELFAKNKDVYDFAEPGLLPFACLYVADISKFGKKKMVEIGPGPLTLPHSMLLLKKAGFVNALTDDQLAYFSSDDDKKLDSKVLIYNIRAYPNIITKKMDHKVRMWLAERGLCEKPPTKIQHDLPVPSPIGTPDEVITETKAVRVKPCKTPKAIKPKRPKKSKLQIVVDEQQDEEEARIKTTVFTFGQVDTPSPVVPPSSSSDEMVIVVEDDLQKEAIGDNAPREAFQIVVVQEESKIENVQIQVVEESESKNTEVEQELNVILPQPNKTPVNSVSSEKEAAEEQHKKELPKEDLGKKQFSAAKEPLQLNVLKPSTPRKTLILTKVSIVLAAIVLLSGICLLGTRHLLINLRQKRELQRLNLVFPTQPKTSNNNTIFNEDDDFNPDNHGDYGEGDGSMLEEPGMAFDFDNVSFTTTTEVGGHAPSFATTTEV